MELKTMLEKNTETNLGTNSLFQSQGKYLIQEKKIYGGLRMLPYLLYKKYFTFHIWANTF